MESHIFMNGRDETELSSYKIGLTFGLNSNKCPPHVKEF